jgi:hypothetical protein
MKVRRGNNMPQGILAQKSEAEVNTRSWGKVKKILLGSATTPSAASLKTLHSLAK